LDVLLWLATILFFDRYTYMVFTPGQVRRAGLVESLTAAGIAPDGLGAAMRGGQISLDFLDEPGVLAGKRLAVRWRICSLSIPTRL
jgi:hypothetical protein